MMRDWDRGREGRGKSVFETGRGIEGFNTLPCQKCRFNFCVDMETSASIAKTQPLTR